MKTPDKIYVRDFGNSLCKVWTYTKGNKKDDVDLVYIRKDAILDLVSKVKAQIIANGWPKKFLAGFDIMCDELIAELESL